MAIISLERTAVIVAEADIFNDQDVCKRWGICAKTLKRYRVRAISDPTLSILVQAKKELLCGAWKEDAVKTLKISFAELQRRIPIAATEEDAKVIHAIAGVTKICGELKIAAGVLEDTAPPVTVDVVAT